jgi:hypothetical protein
MMLKNVGLEKQLKDTKSELEHCKGILQGVMHNKENKDQNNELYIHETPKSTRHHDSSEKLAPRKSVKHVS